MNIEVTGELENAINTHAAQPDVLMPPSKQSSTPTGAAIIEAMQASPYKDILREPDRFVMPVRNVDF